MAEYIEREAAITVPVLPKEHREYQTFNLDDAYEQGWYDALDNLVNIPAADVTPVRHGRWLPTTKWWQGGSAWKQCSECGRLHCGTPNYCNNCGAKMDLEG